MKKQYEQVKLHVTLMNTVFRSDETDAETPRGRHKHRETFDATCILKVCSFDTRVIFMLADQTLWFILGIVSLTPTGTWHPLGLVFGLSMRIFRYS
jgi:hypothetical protein